MFSVTGESGHRSQDEYPLPEVKTRPAQTSAFPVYVEKKSDRSLSETCQRTRSKVGKRCSSLLRFSARYEEKQVGRERPACERI